MYDLGRSVETNARRRTYAEPGRLGHVALIGNFPPRRCGIATFTADLQLALAAAEPSLACEIVAMCDSGGAYAYPDSVTGQVRQDTLADYAEEARRMNRAGVQLACVQHEFGIFGGAAGAHLMTLLNGLNCPIVSTLHTVLENPNDDQRGVMSELIARSSKVVVMSRKGRDILTRVYDAPKRKVEVIPHGAPDQPLKDTAEAKARLGFAGRDLILTFGLLSPNKGIESAIRALPRVVEACPNALYLIVGATHPHLVARDGEAYRNSLQELADELGVGANVKFVNAFVEMEQLLEYLAAADVYVTPYLNEAQITSGTLAYAVALGKPVVSTPYWHAAELLENGAGILTPFGDADAIGAAVAGLLSNDQQRNALARRAHTRGRQTTWGCVGERYVDVFRTSYAERRARPAAKRDTVPALSLRAVERMSDACGMFQHGRFGVPDRDHGYCVDDNARALILTQRLLASRSRDPALDRLSHIYASFVEHAWNPDLGRFRNFMSYERRWLEAEGSEDSCGRAFWSLGETAAYASDPELRRWALHLAERVTPHVGDFKHNRAIAFSILALSHLCVAGSHSARDILVRMSETLHQRFVAAQRSDWRWFEPCLAYDNARLPEALLRAGQALDAPHLRQAGLESLGWLCGVHTAPRGHFRPVGSRSFGQVFATPDRYDQQALEAAAAIDACWAAFDVTGDPAWRAEARRAFAWYLGENDLGVRMAIPETGGCHDGLCPDGLNRNQGAESILSFQLAAAVMRARARAPLAAAAC